MQQVENMIQREAVMEEELGEIPDEFLGMKRRIDAIRSSHVHINGRPSAFAHQ